eukprot:SAG11_NODE_19014_length_476_cov_0.474801_1_plen_73_part_10
MRTTLRAFYLPGHALFAYRPPCQHLLGRTVAPMDCPQTASRRLASDRPELSTSSEEIQTPQIDAPGCGRGHHG